MTKAARERITMEDIAEACGRGEDHRFARIAGQSACASGGPRSREGSCAQAGLPPQHHRAKPAAAAHAQRHGRDRERSRAGDRPIGEPLVQMVDRRHARRTRAGALPARADHALDVRGQRARPTQTASWSPARAPMTKRRDASGRSACRRWSGERRSMPMTSAVFVCSDNREGGRLVGQHLARSWPAQDRLPGRRVASGNQRAR